MREGCPTNKQVVKSLKTFNFEDVSSDTYFEYKSINFLYKKSKHNADNLLVGFHGARQLFKDGSLTSTPIFRYFNLEPINYSLLSISDRLIEDNLDKKLRIAWFLSTKNNRYDEVYDELIKFFSKRHGNVLFSGASGGGFPSLVCGCKFNQKVLIQNGAIYIANDKFFKRLEESMGRDAPINYDIEQIIKKYGPPKYTRVIQNSRDIPYVTNHFEPFKQFIEKTKYIRKFQFYKFTNQTLADGTDGVHEHHINTPENEIREQIMKDIFNM